MPQAPPSDQSGTLPHNHAEISDEDYVIRYITPNDLHTEPNGIVRVASGAYSESSDAHGGMSVVHEGWCQAASIDVMQFAKEPTHGAVRLKVGDLRAAGFQVGYDPLPSNVHHCAVWGIGNGSPRKRRVHRLAQTVKKCTGET
jgi:hypothetical protein